MHSVGPLQMRHGAKLRQVQFIAQQFEFVNRGVHHPQEQFGLFHHIQPQRNRRQRGNHTG